jgi:hypothetical protein
MKKKIVYIYVFTQKAFVKNLKSNANSCSEMANDFLYLKEVHFESFNGKEYFAKYNENLIDLNIINSKLYDDEGDLLLDKIRVTRCNKIELFKLDERSY